MATHAHRTIRLRMSSSLRLTARLGAIGYGGNDIEQAKTAMRRIAIVIFPGFQILDVTGPVAAFEIAGRFRPDSYTLDILSTDGGAVESSSGLPLAAAPL